jgi:DNA repair protein RadC
MDSLGAAVGSVIGIPLIDHVIIGRGKYASIAVEDV